MGLDIYLYTAEQARQNAAYDVASEALYADGPDGKSARDRMSEEEYDAWSERHSYSSSVDVPSEQYPDHLFNRRYLRSSYNGAGFNHAVPQFIATSDGGTYPDQDGSLYWIFEPMGREWDGDEGTLTPDDLPKLQASRTRAVEVAERLRNSDQLRVRTVSPNMFSGPPMYSDDEALRLYRQHIAARNVKADDWYSTKDLEVFGEGLSILAAIPGKATFGIPGVHLIYRGGEGLESYIQSAEIVAEFCDEAISLIERDGSCSMSWSG